MKLPALFLCLLALGAAPAAQARDALGVFGAWAAFRDPQVPRCYAIAVPQIEHRGETAPYADVGLWPKRGVRGQFHLRLARRSMGSAPITLSMGRNRWQLVGGGYDAWAADIRMDAAIIAAMRSAESFTVSARDAQGRSFSDTYPLQGAGTAMDAATVACAGR
ncbi:hypothetical protein EOE18_17660 [Novosphingobium umbonatum]|uniref:Mlr4354 like protein n=1 Tax=Novosphingobium umbonatum TaxID=1908524 RepID=A0A3S2UQR9_9SPHN|nr:invasion associated locus B family protein [Novosphingobium umbonatum]RVU02241.1 hypothetical protein EOE18_17660 [Novosphingobium umbonatum]